MSLSILGYWEALWHKGLGDYTVPVWVPETGTITGTVTGTVSAVGEFTVPVWAPQTGTLLEGIVPVLAPETGTVLGATVPVLVPKTGTILRVESEVSLSRLAGILSNVSFDISSFVQNCWNYPRGETGGFWYFAHHATSFLIVDFSFCNMEIGFIYRLHRIGSLFLAMKLLLQVISSVYFD